MFGCKNDAFFFFHHSTCWMWNPLSVDASDGLMIKFAVFIKRGEIFADHVKSLGD